MTLAHLATLLGFLLLGRLSVHAIRATIIPNADRMLSALRGEVKQPFYMEIDRVEL